MRNTSLIFCAVVLLMTACNDNSKNATATTDSTATAVTETKTDAAPAAMPDSAAMMKAWEDFKTPGDMHKWMAKTNGSWEGEVTQWMDPNAPPTKSKATITQSSALGGRYVISKYSGSMMGMPMEGISTLGYDNVKKLFVNTWVDNLGTGIVQMSGTYDEATKTLNLKGYQTDPMTGKETDIREELTTIDNDSYTMIMYGAGMDGKEMKFMEGLFKRKK
ncbi:MAG: DUF1579 domain-containing protein [Chitinophagaceae bacterium]|nr:DUF1579 domain-containing protein [Chitinophagaceae bacterium]